MPSEHARCLNRAVKILCSAKDGRYIFAYRHSSEVPLWAATRLVVRQGSSMQGLVPETHWNTFWRLCHQKSSASRHVPYLFQEKSRAHHSRNAKIHPPTSGNPGRLGAPIAHCPTHPKGWHLFRPFLFRDLKGRRIKLPKLKNQKSLPQSVQQLWTPSSFNWSFWTKIWLVQHPTWQCFCLRSRAAIPHLHKRGRRVEPKLEGRNESMTVEKLGAQKKNMHLLVKLTSSKTFGAKILHDSFLIWVCLKIVYP